MGSSKTTVQQDNSPWKPLQQPLKDLYSSAGKMADEGVGPQVFPGGELAPMSVPTQAGILGATYESFRGNPLTEPLNQAMQQTTRTGGYNMDMRKATGYLDRIAGMSSNPGGVNPYFEDALNAQLKSASDQVNSYFSAAGRYGSGAHAKALADQLGGIRATTLYNQFNQDIGNAMNASQALAQTGDAAINNLMGITQTAPTLDNLRFSDYDRMLKIGQNIQDYQQAIMNETKAKYEQQNQLPWDYLDRLNSIYQPAAVNFGSSSQTQTKPWSPTSLVGAPMAAMGLK